MTTPPVAPWRGVELVEPLPGGARNRVFLARRGCTVLQLSSHSYQAPGFYRRQGYEEIGALPGWPAGTTRYFFSKTLT